MTFITDLLASTIELESPQSFWYWSGLAVISAVVKDNVYLKRGYKDNNTYPNIYVMLHADSGLKKGPPVALAKSLVKSTNNTRIISGRSSIQAILKELGTAYTAPGGKVNTKSTAFIVASEFSSAIVNDPAAMTILTDLYDRNYNEGEFRSLLKMETFNLKDPTITLLVATNEAHFTDFVASKDVHGGFIGRMFIIAESEVHTLNPLMRELQHAPDRNKLIEYLKILSSINGQFNVEEEVIKIYEEWYFDFYKKIKQFKIKDDTGTINRFGDSVLKVSMLLALSEKPELNISADAMNESIKICEKLIGNVRQTVNNKRGYSSTVNQKALIIQELYNRTNHMITRTQLLKQYWMHFDQNEWDNNIFPTLHQAGVVRMESHGNVIIYMMPDEEVEKYKHYYEGKSKSSE